MCLHACMHTCVHACVDECVHACVRVCMGVCVCACVCACVRHKCTYIAWASKPPASPSITKSAIFTFLKPSITDLLRRSILCYYIPISVSYPLLVVKGNDLTDVSTHVLLILTESDLHGYCEGCGKQAVPDPHEARGV